MATSMSSVVGVDSSGGGDNVESPDKYWATETKSERLASSVIRRIKAYRENMRQTGLSTRIRKSWSALMGYGPRSDSDASRITNTGDIGELLNLNVNQYAALMNQVVTLTTGNKPSVKAIAANSDFKSLGQAQFAEALNDYYDTALRVSDREYEVTELMVALGEGHLALDWDAAVGQPFTVAESGKIVRSGDVRLYTCTPFDIARDPHIQDIESQTWIAFRRRVSKWELIALYPDKKDQILAHTLKFNDSYNDGIDGQAFTGDEFSLDFRQKNPSQNVANDMVFMWEFRHKPTAALPNGRLAKFLGDDCVLFDTVVTTEAGIRTVERAPRGAFGEDLGGSMGAETVAQWMPESVEDKGYPYGDQLFFISEAAARTPGGVDGRTSFFDLMSMQEGVDLAHSIMGSAINAGGLQNMFVPRGANITANKLTGALNVVEYDGDQVPQVHDNVSINAAVPAWAESLLDMMRQRVALNEVTTGDMQRAMPAQAMALLRAQSIEFHSRLQAAYENLIQRSRTGILKMLQLFAEADRVALIAGKSNMWALESFKSQDLKDFDRFIIEPINPMMKTLAGKVSFALPLLEKGMISPQQYLALGNTGRLEPINKFAGDNQARLEREKEKLLRGVGLPPMKLDTMGQPVINNDGLPEVAPDGKEDYVVPLITDPFWDDIPEYERILLMPGVRNQPVIVQKTLEVIHRCAMLWSKQPLWLTMLLNGKPYPSQLMAQQAMGMAGGPPPEMGQTPQGPQGGGGPSTMSSGAQPGPQTNAMPPGAPAVKQPKPPALRMADPQLQRVAEENPPVTQ
jgi:hypothetical protein